MTKQIGPTFGRELAAAGCGNGVSFTVNGTDADIQISGVPIADAPALLTAVQAVVAAHDSTKQLPDAAGFQTALKEALGGIVAANELATKYPLFQAALDTENFGDVQALIVDAHATGAIDTQQYAAIKQLAAQHSVPVTLP